MYMHVHLQATYSHFQCTHIHFQGTCMVIFSFVDKKGQYT